MSIGVFGIGLAAYWPQFEGLKERIEGYQRRVEERVGELGGEVVSAGLVDSEQAAPRGGRPLRGRPGRPRALPCRDLRDLEHGAPGRAGRQGAGAAARAAADRRASTTRTRAPASGWPTAPPAACRSSRARSRARASPTTRSRARSTTTSARGRRSAPGCARRASRARCAALAHRLPRARVSGDARHVHRLHDGPRAGRRARRGAGDRRPRRAGGAADDAEVEAKVAEIREMFAFADPSDDPIAGPIEDDALDWSARVAVGLDKLVEDFELDALTYYYRGVGDNEAERLGAGPDRRQLAAHRARDPDGRRGRPQDQPRAADPRPARRGRLLHRVLRARLRRGLRADGPRRPGPRRDRPGAADAARAPALPRQERRRAERRVQGPLRAGDDRRLHPDRRRAAEAAGRRGRVDPRRDVPDRQHQQPPALRPPARRVPRALVRAGPDPPRRARRRPRGAARCARVARMLDLEYAEVG